MTDTTTTTKTEATRRALDHIKSIKATIADLKRFTDILEYDLKMGDPASWEVAGSLRGQVLPHLVESTGTLRAMVSNR